MLDRPVLEAVLSAPSDSQAGDQDAPTLQPEASASAALADGSVPLAIVATPVQSAAAIDSAPSVGAASDTVANLSSQIVQKAGGRTTRFDVQLDPLGLGRVNVSVEIDAAGAMSAALSFEKPEAANLLKSHAAELQQSLSQAGFNLSAAALSFSTVDPAARSASSHNALLGAGADGGGGGQPQNGQAQNGQTQGGHAQTAGRAFGAASLAAAHTDQIATAAGDLTARGLDIRI